MAKVERTVRIRARVSFNEIQEGDESSVRLTPRVQALLNAGLVEVVGDGKDSTGPRGPESDDDERESQRTA